MNRTQEKLQQGSQEWHAFRLTHFGASEAGAMMGLSPYKTRDQLLTEKKTGLVPEVDAFTQKIFDKGHAVEALARPIVEKMIGEELSAVTYSFGKLSASCDGISYMGDVAWENKQFNAELFEQVKNGELPAIHIWQCQQVLYVTGAGKLFFTISDGTEERTAGVWVVPDREVISKIINGWNQFEIDLENHVPPVQVEKVEAETIQSLPVPSVVVRGEITTSNLNEITPLFDKYLGGIKTELSTDQDFADAEANAKNCRETAKRIQSLRTNIIAQMVDVNAVDSVLANYEEAFNKVGLRLEKAVKEQKEMLKTNAILKAQNEYITFVNDIEKTMPFGIQVKLYKPDFASAIKGVKTLKSMQSNINDALANGKAEATALATDVKTKLAYITEAIKGYEHLFAVHDLVFNDIEFIKLKIQSEKDDEDKRKAEHELAIKAKAEAEVRLKIESDAVASPKEVVAMPSPTALREAVVSHQDEIATFLKSRNLSDAKYSEYRAVLVEFVKHQSLREKLAA
jgi:putative phage-type endonuclease